MNVPQNILLIRYEYLGDVVMNTSLAHSIREVWPNSTISFLTKSYYVDALKNLPFIDNIFSVDSHALIPSLAYLRVLSALRSRRFDLVVDTHSSFKGLGMALLPGLIGATYRLGYTRRLHSLTFTSAIRQKTYEKSYMDQCCDVVRPVMSNLKVMPPVFMLEYTELEVAQQKLQSLGVALSDVVGVLPAGRLRYKKWPNASFRAIVQELTRLHGSVIVLGGPQDASDIEETLVGVQAVNTVQVIAKGIRELAALIGCCKYVVCNDSGPKHIAAALGVPSITPYGPADPKVWGAYGTIHQPVFLDLDCQPCNNFRICPLGTSACLTNLKPKAVMDVVARFRNKGANVIGLRETSPWREKNSPQIFQL